MRAHPATFAYREQLLLNAYCIDFVHGGVYAWTYLAKAGLRDAEIVRILSAPAETWCYKIGNAESTARTALIAAGIIVRCTKGGPTSSASNGSVV